MGGPDRRSGRSGRSAHRGDGRPPTPPPTGVSPASRNGGRSSESIDVARGAPRAPGEVVQPRHRLGATPRCVRNARASPLRPENPTRCATVSTPSSVVDSSTDARSTRSLVTHRLGLSPGHAPWRRPRTRSARPSDRGLPASTADVPPSCSRTTTSPTATTATPAARSCAALPPNSGRATGWCAPARRSAGCCPRRRTWRRRGGGTSGRPCASMPRRPPPAGPGTWSCARGARGRRARPAAG